MTRLATGRARRLTGARQYGRRDFERVSGRRNDIRTALFIELAACRDHAARVGLLWWSVAYRQLPVGAAGSGLPDGSGGDVSFIRARLAGRVASGDAPMESQFGKCPVCARRRRMFVGSRSLRRNLLWIRTSMAPRSRCKGVNA